eukprot:scaffold57139_cov20-Tisochrysis_lutea.AAC.1
MFKLTVSCLPSEPDCSVPVPIIGSNTSTAKLGEVQADVSCTQTEAAVARKLPELASEGTHQVRPHKESTLAYTDAIR